MKHKLLILLLSIIAVLVFSVCVAGCGNSSSGSQKFTYQLNDDRTYTVTGISGTPGGEFAIEIPSTHKDLPVTKIGSRAFSGYENVTGVTIPDSVISIGFEAFYNCKKLQNITLPNSLISIGLSVFNGTAYYKNDSNWSNGVLYVGNYLIEAKNTLTGNYNIKDGTLGIAQYAFDKCTGLRSVTVSDSVTAISGFAFNGCSGLTNITMGNGIKSIGGSAFVDCSSLTSITIPDGVTSIEAMTFSKCNGLKNVTIPKSVTNIGNGAFDRWVEDIYYSGTENEWKSIKKDSNWTTSREYTIHCSDGIISR